MGIGRGVIAGYRAAKRHRRAAQADKLRNETANAVRASHAKGEPSRHTIPFKANGAHSKHEIVNLESIDGFEFEQLCAKIFEKTGWGKVETLGGIADGGRDIIITAPDGAKTVVECKHYMKSTVGRPIIQKLHSAVITTHAQMGILINTGKFTAEAVEHAKVLAGQHHRIELYDLQKLAEIADGAGIRFGNNVPILTYPIRGADELAGMVLQDASIKSRPKTVLDMFAASIDSIELRACWLANITIRQDFKTSAGVIHSINEHGASYLFDDADGKMLDSFNGEPLEEMPADLDGLAVRAGRFQRDAREMKGAMTSSLISKYTKRVKYATRNNRKYEKKCAPAKKNVTLNHVQKVYVPAYSMTFKAMGREYRVGAVTKNAGIAIQGVGLRGCMICGEAASDAMLCNDCGNITHGGQQHGFECHRCEKTVCRTCVQYARRMLFSKRHFCSDCAPENAKTYEGPA